jgi:hypothetical protein
MDDGFDIPEFLRISAEQRAQAWREWQGFSGPSRVAPTIDNGVGSVARKHGYPESPLDVAARAEIEAGIRRIAEAKKAEGLARLAELKAAQKAERAEIAAVKAAARAQHSKKDESASVSAGRSQDSRNTATEHRHVSDSQYRT